MYSFAENIHSQNARVTLNRHNVLLSAVLDEIERQTDYLFIFNSEVNINHRVSIKAKRQTVSGVLDNLLATTDVEYALTGTHIMLSRKGTSLSAPATATDQQAGKRITGTVIGVNGEPVIGANIVVKGIRAGGAVTDIDGRFSLNVPQDDAVLQISYIGYVTQEIAVGNRTTIDVVLEEDSQLLEEVVVVGYGVQKKANLSGAVAAISSEALTNRPVTNANLAL
ncbi:MAG: carboxypeptidase-like regulatory domain-containing protein, partial [Tannerella sp.]|nr:carboxypeptidase-like regulatory domain-containing protein [Tannerella sp.]